MSEKKQNPKETSKGLDLKDYQDKLITWYETDSAKAVATVIAILLIPAGVFVWNYINDHDFSRPGGKITDKASYTSVYDELEPKPDFTEIFQSEKNEALVSPTPTVVPTVTPTPTPVVTPKPVITNKVTPKNKPIYYKVRKGDSYYKISMKFCRNDYFYRLNRYKNYLMTGTVIKVVCR